MKHNAPLHMLLLAGLIPAVATDVLANGKTVAAPSAVPPVVAAADAAHPPAPAGVAAFLGVEVASCDFATSRNLGLSPGTGLRVRFVAPQSPASEALRVGDILALLDAQILCNSDQFRTLVRARKPGENIALKVHRDGTLTVVNVKLGSTVAPAVPEDARAYRRDAATGDADFPEVRFRINGRDVSLNEMLRAGSAPFGNYLGRYRDADGVVRFDVDEFAAANRERLQQLGDAARRNAAAQRARAKDALEAIQRLRQNAAASVAPAPVSATAPASSGDASCAACRTFFIRDNTGTASLMVSGEKRHLKIQDAAGGVIFDGEVSTPEQQAVLTDHEKKILKTIEQLAGDTVQAQ